MIVFTAIPVTLALTLAVFYLYGYTLNRITLFALIFSIGILVDDSTVVLENIERKFAWIHNFDVLVWSFQHGIAKPDPAIYRYTLERLGTGAADTLFIDDRLPNVEAALALGMKAIEFKSIAQLHSDLEHADWDHSLPLP